MRSDARDIGAVSFDLFGTLVAVDPPHDSAAAVGAELAARGVAVPADWEAAYRERHLDAPPGAEVSLCDHVEAVLTARGVDLDPDGRDARGGRADRVVRRAVDAAFDPDVRTRPGAVGSLRAAADRGPVGVLSNCSVSGLARRTLSRSSIDPRSLDAVVTSVDCGWRKPDRRAFEAIARELGVPVDRLGHVGDDPRTDGGVADAGGTFVSIADEPLSKLPRRLEGACPP